ncbi:hypothetical protein C8F01DRAFT_1101270 [Mycena amicta]|nr:hypothetical protein C8F01DRAFT_1101270 [Mycena amicta]
MSTLPTFTEDSTAQEVASALKEEITGKNVLITGTSINGIGFEAARGLAPYANLLVITGYNAERLKLSEEALKKEFPTANIRTLTLDLSSLASVRKAAAEVNAYTEPLHVLIHNAATMATYYLTEDNLEIQMATAQFGPFLLTKLLAAKLVSSRTQTFVPRVVYVSSGGHASGKGIDFTKLRLGDAPEEARTTPVLVARYAETKAANVLMATELSRRAKGQIRAYSLNPGVIPTNGIEKPAFKSSFKQMGILDDNGKPKENELAKWKTLPQGAATTLAAAFDPRIDDIPGAYLADGVAAPEQAAPYATDPDTAKKLWDLTEEILGEKFEFL